MTAVLAIDFLYQILVLADCRVAWDPPVYSPQDNLQKIYPCGPTGILGFSGIISTAKSVIKRFQDTVSGKPLPPSAADIVSDLAESARVAYSELPHSERGDLELMYVAPDYGNVTMVAENVTFAKNLMIKMVQPEFLPTAQADAVRLGYATQYPMDILRENRNNQLNLGLTPEGRQFQVGIAVGGIAPLLAKYAPHQVGGLFTIGIATARGIGWWPYGPVSGLELVIDDGQFIQVDHQTHRRIPLQSIIEFDPSRQDAGNLMFGTPAV
jgi:hypothetical protein